ncbi:Transmembrane 7 superfamily member 3, partial [Pseudolycoriella hygida]
MFVYRCICLLLMSAPLVIQCRELQFFAKSDINSGSIISIDASKPSTDDITFYAEFSLDAYTVNTISVYNFTDLKYGFGILQVHSCWYNLTLSYNRTIQRNFHENGTDLGLTLYPWQQNPQELYVHNHNYFTSVNISVALILYNKTTPEPGGCNMEYPMANTPLLIVTFHKKFMNVDTPLAAFRADESNEVKRCNASLSYIGYHLYLNRGDYTCRSLFDGIKSFMTVGGIEEMGIPSAAVPGGAAHRRSYVTVPGTGIVFQTIVSGEAGTSSYVPRFTTSCSPPLLETSCDAFDSALYRVLAGLLVSVGIIRAYFCDFLKAIGVFIDGFIFGLLLTFNLTHLSEANTFEDKAEQILFTCALFVAMLITLVFTCFEILRSCFICLPTVIVGWLLGAVIVYFTDDLFYELKSYGWMYETVFIASIVGVTILISPLKTLGPLILGATSGSFYIVHGFCIAYGNHLNYVILNALRYTLDKDFRKVHSTPSTNVE